MLIMCCECEWCLPSAALAYTATSSLTFILRANFMRLYSQPELPCMLLVVLILIVGIQNRENTACEIMELLVKAHGHDSDSLPGDCA